MKCSVALCTYNGEKYIEQQIRSILSQSVPVDEIVVCDDGSTDSTLSIIDKLRQESESVNFSIYVNHQKLGVCANFDKAIHLCSGDIIFLSDQDDIWNKDKVSVIIDYFQNNIKKNVVFTNGYLIVDNIINELIRISDCLGIPNKELNDNDILMLFLQYNRAVGATMAFRHSFIGKFEIDISATLKNNRALHDYIIAFSAIKENNSLGYIPLPLINYRIHKGQQCGLSMPSRFSDPRHPKLSYGIPDNLISKDMKETHTFLKKRYDYRSILNSWVLLFCMKDYKKYYSSKWFEMISYDLFIRHWNHLTDFLGKEINKR